MWNLILLIAFIILLWYCSIKAYFTNRKDRMEGEKETAEIIDLCDEDDIDWDTGETRIKIIHTKK